MSTEKNQLKQKLTEDVLQLSNENDRIIKVIEITTGKDSSSEGSLRSAVSYANMQIAEDSSKDIVLLVIMPSVSHIVVDKGELKIIANIILSNQADHDVIITSKINQSVFHVLEPNTIFKIDGGKHRIVLQKGNSMTNGGAILVESATNTVILVNTILKNNKAIGAGGAIYTQGRVILISSILTHNEAGTQGGAIWSALGITTQKSQVKENIVSTVDISSAGGGLLVDNGDVIITDHSCVSKNQCKNTETNGGSGGGICVMSGSIFVLNNSSVNHNKAFNSGGIQQGLGNVWIMKNSSVSHNQSFNSAEGAAGGGGVTTTLGTTYVSQSQVSHNKTVGMFSGGCLSLIGDVIVQDNSRINHNTNRGPGGGIACNINGSIVVSRRSQVAHNTGASLGGGIVNFSLQAGSIVISGNSSVMDNVLTNAETIGQTLGSFLSVVKNYIANLNAQATKSGGEGSQQLINALPALESWAEQTSDALQNTVPIIINGISRDKIVGGGGIASLLLTPVTISTDSRVSNNKAGVIVDSNNSSVVAFGGGIFCLNSQMTLDNATIENNSSTGSGGGLFTSGGLICHDSTIKSNHVGRILDPHQSYQNNSSEESGDNALLGSKQENGGGLFNDASSNDTLINTKIILNTTRANGGGIANNGSLILISTQVKDNHAAINHNEIDSTTVPIILE